MYGTIFTESSTYAMNAKWIMGRADIIGYDLKHNVMVSGHPVFSILDDVHGYLDFKGLVLDFDGHVINVESPDAVKFVPAKDLAAWGAYRCTLDIEKSGTNNSNSNYGEHDHYRFALIVYLKDDENIGKFALPHLKYKSVSNPLEKYSKFYIAMPFAEDINDFMTPNKLLLEYNFDNGYKVVANDAHAYERKKLAEKLKRENDPELQRREHEELMSLVEYHKSTLASKTTSSRAMTENCVKTSKPAEKAITASHTRNADTEGLSDFQRAAARIKKESEERKRQAEVEKRHQQSIAFQQAAARIQKEADERKRQAELEKRRQQSIAFQQAAARIQKEADERKRQAGNTMNK